MALVSMHVPQGDRAIDTATSKPLTIGTPGDHLNLSACFWQGLQAFARGDIPDLKSLIQATGGQHLAIGTPGDGLAAIDVTGENLDAFTRGDIPESDRLIQAATRQDLTSGMPRHRDHPILMPL